MSGIKQLAGQTMWYGVSSIAARFLNYLLTPYITTVLFTAEYGEMSLVYSFIPFLNIIFTYGLETAFFRYIQKSDTREDVYSTITISLIASTISFTALLLIFRGPLADLISLKNHTEYITWAAFIIAFDALSTIGFARLRQDGRPIKFAAIRIAGILINIGLVIFFLSVCPAIAKKNPNSFIGVFYKKENLITYILLANLAQAVISFLLLYREFFNFKWKFNFALWKEIMPYSLPLVIAGLGGMINETMDRIMLGWWSTAADPLSEIGVYSACYKLAILISLFVQAFRLGAEPFFFKQASGENAQRTYARVMKFFVIAVSGMFLVVMLYLDIWKHFLRKPEYWEGLSVVPILLFANIFLGIYYNLSIWYKLSNKTGKGATITLIGAAITILVNYLFIPSYGYMACAWATFFCYGTMMVLSFTWGQKVYPIPYAWKKLLAYLIIVLLIFWVYRLISLIGMGDVVNFAIATLLLGAYAWFILRVERKEFQRFPIIGKFIK
ncbi:MAG: oligosaccharide flippase family protein [Chitinophagaceae bacterium]|nr:oligosaccharide flippase family protein [Chitinophagaceae bacterium]